MKNTNNTVICECCKELKDRGTEMFPIKLILPAYTHKGDLTVCITAMCLECAKKCADNLKKYIQGEDFIFRNDSSFVA